MSDMTRNQLLGWLPRDLEVTSSRNGHDDWQLEISFAAGLSAFCPVARCVEVQRVPDGYNCIYKTTPGCPADECPAVQDLCDTSFALTTRLAFLQP